VRLLRRAAGAHGLLALAWICCAWGSLAAGPAARTVAVLPVKDAVEPAEEPVARAATLPVLPDDHLVLLITSADHRADHLGAAWAGVDIDTPSLDALARRGRLFTQAWGSSTLPVGALAGVLTGTSPRDSGLLDPGHGLADDVPTLARAFAAAGYATLAVLSEASPAGDPGLAQGFDTVRAPQGALRSPAEQVVSLALEELADAPAVPLFLWVHLSDGSWPHEPAPAHLARYHDPADDPRFPGMRPAKIPSELLPAELADVRDLDWPAARYKASLTGLDEALAPLLDHRRVASGTVAYAGVTGLLLGEHGTWFRRLGPYPGALRVPLILAGPGVASGLREGRLVSTLDLGRTLLDGVGAAAVPFPGASLTEDRGNQPVFAIDVGALAVAATDGRHLLVLTLGTRGMPLVFEGRTRGERELYDLTVDPLGERDLATDEGPELDGLSQQLVDWMDGAESLPWAVERGLAPEARAVFRSLGYVKQPTPAPEHPWDISDAAR
jgi:arylsulfatase A-like enzyme